MRRVRFSCASLTTPVLALATMLACAPRSEPPAPSPAGANAAPPIPASVASTVVTTGSVLLQSGATALAEFEPTLPPVDEGGECVVGTSPVRGARQVTAWFPTRESAKAMVILTIDSTGRVIRYSERRGVPRYPELPPGATAAMRDSLMLAAQRDLTSTVVMLDYAAGRAMAHNVTRPQPGSGITGGIEAFATADKLGRPAEREKRVIEICGARREARRATLAVSRAERIVRPRATKELGAGNAGATLIARVATDSGHPLYGAEVRLTPTEGGPALPYLMTTDDDGAVGLTGIPAGRYRGTVRRMGMREVSWTYDGVAGRPDTLALTITLAPPEASPICTTTEYPAIELLVRDSTARRVPPSDVVAVVRDGAYVDTLVASPLVRPDSLVLRVRGASERPGTYAITVSHPEYGEWRRTGIQVRASECHVVTRRFTVPLFRRR